MQLYAFDVNNRLIFSSFANKQKNYICPECKNIVRLRGGLHRQNHFFHLQAVRECRQSGKSMQHLAVQMHFLEQLPHGECCLEYPFPQIGRIADVIWLPHQIIFEIQCSFITAAEVEARNSDYASQGYQVVWILHDQRYNRTRLSPMELFLQGKPHYFTNMKPDRKGDIYDQFAFNKQQLRLHRLTSLPIDITELKKIERLPSDKMILQNLINRNASWHGYFAGDLMDIFINNSEVSDNYILKAKEIEESYESKKNRILITLLDFVNAYIVRPYIIIFKLLLERCSK